MRSVVNLTKKLLLALILTTSLPTFADKLGQVGNRWGVLFLHRTTENPYRLRGYNHDIIPLIYFEKNSFYIHGLDLGYQLYKPDTSSALQVVSKYRFFDLPLTLRAQRDDGINIGVEYNKELHPNWTVYLDLLSDLNGAPLGELKTSWSYNIWKFTWDIYLDFLLKSARYNKRYYGLGEKDSDADIDTKVGIDVKVNVFKNIYLVSGGGITYYGSKTLRNSALKRPSQQSYYVGGGLMDATIREHSLKSKYYQRYAWGLATPSNTDDILYKLKSEPDKYHNQLASFFYGIPLSDDVSTLPIAVHFQPGIAYHFKNQGRQDQFLEYIGIIKLSYTIPLPWRLRLGIGEGLSYSTHISDIEKREMDMLGLESSKLLNYLDYSLDFSVHDIVKADITKGMWLGWYLHHRSGIYGTSILFNKVRGGSNYNMFYFMYEY